MAQGKRQQLLISLTVDVVSAYLGNNALPGDTIGELIVAVHGALAALDQASPSEAVAERRFEPAVSLRKSLESRDHIISMIDGKPYRTLTRHLARRGLTPAQYRARYGLPVDYPMNAPTFVEERRALARKIGFGNRPKPSKKISGRKGSHTRPRRSEL